MDARVFRMTILAIISAFLLVLVIVYATNADRINEMFGKNNSTASEEATTEISEVEVYGDQIGDNLEGFLYDDDFFDETESITAAVVIKKNSDASAGGSSDAADVELSIDNTTGSGMAVVGQLDNPNAGMSGFGFNGDVMPGGDKPAEGAPLAPTQVGVPQSGN